MVSERFVQIMCYLVLMLCQMSVYGFWTKYSAYHGWRLHSGSTVLARHKHDCAWLAQMTDSAVVSFRAKMECRTTWEVTKLIAGEEEDVVYVASHLTSSRPMFIKGDTEYSYTNLEASQTCTTLGARLMSASELQHVFDTHTGFASCSCGWVQGGIAQSIDGTACNATARAITNCVNLLAHAWCIIDV